MTRILLYAIFTAGLLMGLILIAIGMAESVPNAAGLPHPSIAGTQIGGDGLARLATIGGLGFAFHALLLFLIVTLSALGVHEKYQDSRFILIMLGILIFNLVVCWAMWSGHRAFLETGTTGYFMGFPTPTAWQVYGTWLGAIPLIVLYCWGFRRYIYTAEDEIAFEQLLEDVKDKQ